MTSWISLSGSEGPVYDLLDFIIPGSEGRVDDLLDFFIPGSEGRVDDLPHVRSNLW